MAKGDKAPKKEVSSLGFKWLFSHIDQVSNTRFPIQTKKPKGAPHPPPVDLWPMVPLPHSLLPQPRGIHEFAGPACLLHPWSSRPSQDPLK